MKLHINIYLILAIFCLQIKMHAQQKKKPNLLIIQTDEHNLRTIGAYRATMSKEQGHIWGENNIVETPHIDMLAKDGALFTNWYATSPVCTPSRASLVTGLYPVATGSPVNNMPMKDEMLTFAQILKENGYATSYVGKWHLDGDNKPGFEPERKFGFSDNRYMFNRGHWKILGENKEGPFVDQKKTKYGGGEWSQNRANKENFTTDFLVDRTLEILKRDKDKPFCLMLSIPDPHGPDQVRAPYNTKYADLKFETPKTANAKPNQVPGWLNLKGKNSINPKSFQKNMVNYFGMVKNIDDNIGRILTFLKENNIEENTIVVFTSDHGDLYGEHGKLNKGLPYEMSARVAFLLRYPDGVKSGKTIQKAFTMADFTPTILGLMDVNHSSYNFHGIDASSDLTNQKMKIKGERIVYITHANKKWVAAVDNQYKLVLSPQDKPWLFDLEKDPNELVNFYNDPAYKKIAERLEKELYAQMKKYKEPLQKSKILK